MDTADDDHLEERVNQAKWFAGIGTAGPAVVAGTMLIIFRIAMALFVGFAPIFILCLLFKKTAPLFQKWLFYGLATIFSSVLLGVMSEIATDLVTNVAGTLFVADKLLTFVGGAGVNGIMEASTQQLGLGLILSTLLITVPPMAGMWFNGLMSAAYYGTNYLSGWNGGQPPLPGSGAGSGAHMQQVENRVAPKVEQFDRIQQTNSQMVNTPHGFGLTNGGINTNDQPSDLMKSQSQIRQSQLNYQANNIELDGNTDKTKSGKGEKA